MPQKKIISLTLDEDVIVWLDEIAKSLGMSRSEFVNMILSGGKDARNMLDKLVDNWFDRKKADVDIKRAETKAKLEVPAKSFASPRKGVGT
jgi:hypothetical protein